MLHSGIGLIAVVLAAGVGLSQAGASGDAAYRQEIQKWREGRIERLTKPSGWLSLVGLDWLKDGRNTLGSAKDNDIVIPTAPAHLGTITLGGGKASIALDAKSAATIDAAAKLEGELLDDTHDTPTTVAFGTTNFFVIKRDDKYALRIKDSEAATRKHFVGIDYFDIDPSWRIEAKWEAYNPPHEVEEPNVIGQIDKVIVPGAAVFERDGQKIRVEPVIETPGDTELFLVFADKTSGKETYGAARFVYTEPPKDGKVIIDFNKAYNPPCAFTPYATCPLPTAQNRMKVRVAAGEKKYRGGHE
jgi:uncharacterized protein (DUF1684 family)